jgi:hypothetical protein
MATEKFSQFTDAILPLTGGEIFPFAISGLDNYQIGTQDFVNQVMGFGQYLYVNNLWLNDGSGLPLSLVGDGDGSWLFNTGGNLTFTAAENIFNGTAYFYGNLLANQLQNTTADATYLDSGGNIIVSDAHTFYDNGGNPGFTGSGAFTNFTIAGGIITAAS